MHIAIYSCKYYNPWNHVDKSIDERQQGEVFFVKKTSLCCLLSIDLYTYIYMLFLIIKLYKKQPTRLNKCKRIGLKI